LPAGSRVYISGQADPGSDLAQATRRTLEGLDRTLAHVGLDRSRVVRVKAFLRPMTAAEEVEREVVAFFGSEAVPPLTLVEWQSKNPIEIELIVAGDRKPAGNSVEYLTPPGLKPSPVFSRVARVNGGDLVYVSGLYGPAQSSGARQVESIFEVLGKHLEAAGSDFRHLVKATYYVTDEDASRALNELRSKYYDPARPPAASKALAGVDAAGRTITLDMIAVVKPAGGGDQGRIRNGVIPPFHTPLDPELVLWPEQKRNHDSLLQ
jgi:enamine deaminase RidA (YjgF/YER057c/UK114 family)